jgi:hypothetical protein
VEDLIGRGVDVSEVEERRPPGFDAQNGRSYFAYASAAAGRYLAEVKQVVVSPA